MRIAIIYNTPEASYYTAAGEQKAVDGVLVEAAAVEKSLRELSHRTESVGLGFPLEQVKERLGSLEADLVFNLFEGFSGMPGSEPEIPVLLDELGIRYTGCPPEALRLALDKSKTKQVLKDGGVETPGGQLLDIDNLHKFSLDFPCIVKPNGEDASHGLTAESVVLNPTALRTQVARMAENYGPGEVLVEEYIDGREFNATVLGNRNRRTLAISEIVFSLPAGLPDIITYAGKWEEDSAYYRGTIPVCPADITDGEKDRISVIAEKSCFLTGCRGYARVDMRMDRNGRVYVLEVNPNPDISPDSGAALQARTAGLGYTAFIGKIVDLAMEE